MASNVAYAQDADDDHDSAIEGGEKNYARSIAPGSPTKERPNSGKSRAREAIMRRSSLSPTHGQTDSDDTLPPAPRDRSRRVKEKEQIERERKEERRRLREEQKELERRERARAAAPKKPAVRPSAKHTKTAPVVHTQPDEYRRPRFEDDPSQYGIPQPRMQPAQGHRPRASTRPNSYYGQGSRPPPANERWYASQVPEPYVPSPMSQQSPFTPPYAQQPWGPPTGAMPYPVQAPPPPSSGDYFPPPSHAVPIPGQPSSQSHLAHRFQQRPSSAVGHRSMSASFDHEPYEKENMMRRRSVKIRDEREDDPRKKLMPPPPRPKTSQPPRQALKPPPAPRQRQIAPTGYESEDSDGEDSMYQEVVRYQYDDGVVDRPPSHRRGSSTYSRDGYRIEPAPSSGRRHSYIGSAGGSYSEQKYEAAEDAALAYQNGVNGGPSVPLTAAALKAAKKSNPSRSSGSSESRDESEFRQSATTRTTRSSALDSEDVTIKVTGSAVLKIGNAEIQCQDGGEINITQAGRLGGSDKASTIYSDDRQTRRERLPIRARASSQADSWARSQVSSYDYPKPPFF
ncbi:hypothetical protein CMUS01_02995 [Colletotrichum musicola]|uniref:Uncharacterized protein n=1 Tax=Colletotrichum musicola TaxID=2175873 RepID=A0A8H6NTZ9_9PEZI|nr:hypothetical protein CMUS01_02995 [Colletotrichum musicola]